MKYCLTLLFCILPILAFSQNVEGTSLDLLSYEQLLSRFEEVEHDSILAEPIAREYLNRARREGDTIKMARGYDRLARIFHHEKNIAMADSLIALTKDIEHITYPGLGYLLKAYNEPTISYSNEYLLRSYYYARLRNNEYQQFIILSILFTRKNNWGDSEEAYLFLKRNEQLLNDKDFLSNIKQTFREEINKDSIAKLEYDYFRFLNSLDHIESFNSLQKFDSIDFYANRAKNILNSFPKIYKSSYSIIMKVLNVKTEFYQGKYENTEVLTNELLSENLRRKQKLPVHFYRGLSLIKLGYANEGVSELKKAERYISASNIKPEYRRIYDTLVKYNSASNYKFKDYLLRRAYSADSIIKINLRAINPSIIKYVETPRLISEKEETIIKLDYDKKRITIVTYIIGGFLTLTIIYLIYIIYKNRKYKKRFENLINKEKNNEITDKRKNEIPTEVIKNILDQLEKFEANESFIDSNITLHSLAKSFGTNDRYLSKVINIKKGKHFPTYLNDLRVDYAVEKCQNNPLFRKFTIKAIAQECGFNSAESFSRAFYRKLKLYPSYYIKNLIKNELE